MPLWSLSASEYAAHMSELFADIVGHQRVKDGLIHAAANDRVHHAWLFAGREGIGKALLAKRFAQLLMCEHSTLGAGPSALSICTSCRHCTRIEAGEHPDFERVVPDGRTIKIKQVRELQRKVTFHPYEARFRVVLIEDAQNLGDAAANALLKTLEEPTDRTLFVLLTDQLHRVLVTIISRSQVVRFARFSQDELTHALRQRGVAEDRARLAVLLAYGSLGRALELAEDDTLDAIVETVAAVETLERRGVSAALALADDLAGKRDQLPLWFATMRAHFRDLMVLASGARDTPIGFSWRRDALAARANTLHPERIFAALDALLVAERAIDRNVSPLIAMESLMLKLGTLPS